MACSTRLVQEQYVLPKADLSASNIDFGEVEWGDSLTRNLVLTNNGELPMGIGSITLGEDEKRPAAWHFEGEGGSLDVGMESVVVKANGRSQTHRRVRVRSMQDQMSELVACLDDPSRTHRGAGELGYTAMEALIGILESARLGEPVAMPVAQMAYPLDELPS